MGAFTIILTILGLCVFETISSVDNAIINAEVLSDMRPKARRWFLLWGMLFAVFVVRGLLPWLIVWITNPALGAMGALTSTLSSDPRVIEAVESSAPVLLIGAGTFLLFLFFHLPVLLYLSEYEWRCDCRKKGIQDKGGKTGWNRAGIPQGFFEKCFLYILCINMVYGLHNGIFS
jgi:hypothetical protein